MCDNVPTTRNSSVCNVLPGVHLEIDPRGGKMSIYEKEGGEADMYIFLSCVCFYCTAVYCLFFYLYLFSYFSKLLKLRFLTQSTLHLLILLNSEAKIFNTLFYSLIFLSC